MPHETALERREAPTQGAESLCCLWKTSRPQGVLPETLLEVAEVWRSLADEDKLWAARWVIGPSWIKRLRKWNKETLKAAGNGNPPWVPYLIASWIKMEALP